MRVLKFLRSPRMVMTKWPGIITSPISLIFRDGSIEDKIILVLKYLGHSNSPQFMSTLEQG